MRQLLRILIVLTAIIVSVGMTQPAMTGACVGQNGTAPGNPLPCD